VAGVVALEAAAALVALNVVWNVYSTLRGLRAVVRPPKEVEPPEHWPKVSLIVPACNEADGLEAATRSKLSSDYPNLEVVLVDDRSTDATPEIADRLGADDARVRVVHIQDLPAGWLGKVHALDRGVREASGEWLLFSDADVQIAPDVIRRVMARAIELDADFVALSPQFISTSFLLDVVLASFFRMLVVMGRLWKVPDPDSRAAVGGGVFGLVRRSAYDRTRGFSWLRLEIADDVGLGQMLKHSGARCFVFNDGAGVRLRFYNSVGDLMRGVEKNGYAVLGGLNPIRMLLIASFVLFAELSPVAALLIDVLWVRLAGVGMVAGMAFAQAAVARHAGNRVLPALVPAVGPFLLVLFMLRSAVLTHWRGGIVWRGTHYSLNELRAGRRFEIF
jgi:glycosyltransferase involved in cell wall biosynthesis